MLRRAWLLLAPVLFASAALTSHAQTPSITSAPNAPATPRTPMPRDYRGVQIHIDGIFVTPIPNAPFTASVQIVSHQVMPDGTERVVKTENHIARSSSGRIRNERRALVPSTFNGKPRLISAHFYDPNTRENIYTETATHIARQSVLPRPPSTPAMMRPPDQQPKFPGVTVTALGDQNLGGVTLTGTRKTRIVPADQSGTGKPVTITDEYWYSAELSIYLIIRHNDPRTGEQLVAVTQIERAEPSADMMQVPTDYKLVDETPPQVPPDSRCLAGADNC
ncbi:hypothetical protein SAMN05421819_1821 [Bryocella elongata]|uniref:Uncharacterized protein n=1 Tax=Bryocella elongata TaxID=863522 RepID=A0A1H5X1N1_9BACT|nr:hypothetical protein [Bryocella elongata]SEG05207.1 hypothetical protein SAMN05421819_1821 [Bryocella elongata]